MHAGAEGRSTVFPLVILAHDRSAFQPATEDLHGGGAEIRAIGLVDVDRGLPRMLVTGPQNITLVKRGDTPHHHWPDHAHGCDAGVSMPRLTREVKPNYTREAIRARKQGVVSLEALVGVDGRVQEVHVSKSLDADTGLDAEAIRAIRQWRFAPGTRAGQPVAVPAEIEMTFTLTDRR